MGCGSASVGEECEEESGGSGGPEAGRITTPAVGEWRSVRAAALCDVGADRGGSLAGQGKEAESERTIAAYLLWRVGPELMKREPESIQEVWQTTTSTALFG